MCPPLDPPLSDRYKDKALLKSNRSLALHAYIVHPLILHFDKPLCLTICDFSCTKGVQIPTRLLSSMGPILAETDFRIYPFEIH